MDIIFYIGCGIVVVALVTMIAIPERLVPNHPLAKKKSVSSNYWGVYEDADPETSVGNVEVEPYAGKHKSNYGAISYAQGKGVSRRGA